MATDYSKRDFVTIREDLLTRANRIIPEWTDRDPSDFGMVLVDLWAFMGDTLHYYIDNASREAFLTTATQRDSVLAIANLLDYRPKGRTAAQSTVTISNSSETTSYTLPLGTRFLGQVNNTTVDCFTVEPVTIGTNTTGQVRVQEGTLTTEDAFDSFIGTSTGSVSQRFTIPGSNIVTTSVQVFVKEDGINNVRYRLIPRIADAAFGERVFATLTDASGTTEVIFGNRINGFIPPVNSNIYVRFSRSQGADGNYPENIVTTFVNAVSNDLNITSSTAFIGGSNEESIDSMRVSIPRSTRAQNRAVTLKDHVDIALSVPSVYKAAATYNAGLVTIYPVGIQSGYTTSASTSIPVPTEPTDMADEITNQLQPRMLLGVTLAVASEVQLTPINIKAKIFVNERYVQAWVISDVQNALNKLFEFDNVTFGQKYTLSQIYKTIVDVEGVDYAEIDPDGTPAGVFSTTSSGVEQFIVVDSLKLPRKGTVEIIADPSSGITTAD
jgi:hypothetical protein